MSLISRFTVSRFFDYERPRDAILTNLEFMAYAYAKQSFIINIKLPIGRHGFRFIFSERSS